MRPKVYIKKNGTPYTYDEKLIELLCEPCKKWQYGWGLYVSVSEKMVYHSSSLEIIPLTHPETGKILCFTVKFNGIKMSLCLGKPDHPENFGIYHPEAIIFQKNHSTSKIKINWPYNKTGDSVVLTHTGTYMGSAPDQNLERIK